MLKQGFTVIVGLSALALASLPAGAVDVKRLDLGSLSDGTRIEAVELSNSKGMSARIMTLGAVLQSLTVPDRNGKAADVVLGYATPAEYLAKPQYFGATVGRYANRIRNGQFTLDGKRYTLTTNDGSNHLHGGVRGIDKAVWKIDTVKRGSPASVVMSHVSPDGDGGYPGTLSITATYSLNDQNELSIEYRATTDKPTILNITNHSYFNLAGEGNADILGHRLTLMSDAYTPVDATLIPTGERRNVAGTRIRFPRARDHWPPDSRRAGRADAHRARLRPQLRLARPGGHAACGGAAGRSGLRPGDGNVSPPRLACNSIRATSSTAPWSARVAASTVRATDCVLSRRYFRIRRTRRIFHRRGLIRARCTATPSFIVSPPPHADPRRRRFSPATLKLLQ